MHIGLDQRDAMPAEGCYADWQLRFPVRPAGAGGGEQQADDLFGGYPEMDASRVGRQPVNETGLHPRQCGPSSAETEHKMPARIAASSGQPRIV